MEKVRLDKWLWSIRIFKSRTLATETCRSNHVKINGKPQKPSYQLGLGEMVEVRKNGFDLLFEVVKLIDKRVSATLAQECYKDHTSPDELNKYDAWFVGKGRPEIREKGTGRPTKRERREIDEFKGRNYDFDE